MKTAVLSTKLIHVIKNYITVLFFQLYFDLEYKISQNPRINGQDILTKFKNFIKRDLRTITCMESVKLDHIEILDMDSSTNEKFSHHLIGKYNHYIHFSTK